MDLERLKKDELLVELEIRELIDSTTRKITPSLKQALRDRLQEEKYNWLLRLLLKPHEAAAKQPAQEMARCQNKLFELQQYLLTQSAAGSTAAEILPQLKTTLLHIQGRVERYERHVGRLGAVNVVMELLWDMFGSLFKGLATLGEVAEKLSRVVIRIDMPVSEGEEEEPKEGVVDDEEGDEVENKIECANMVKGTEVVGDAILVEQLTHGSSEDTSLPTDRQEPNRMVSSTVQISDISDINEVDHPEPARTGVTCFPKNVCLVMRVGVLVSTKGCTIRSQVKMRRKIGRKKRKFQRQVRAPRGRSRGKTRNRAKQIRARIKVGIERYWQRDQIPINHLIGVLDLRLEDDVLGRRNRQGVAYLMDPKMGFFYN